MKLSLVSIMKLVIFLLFTCHRVSSYFINVTRNGRDEFTNVDGRRRRISGRLDCYSGKCFCSNTHSTFLTSKLNCISNLKLRNKTISNDWVYALLRSHGAGDIVKVVNLTENIRFKVNHEGTETLQNCLPVSMEIIKNGAWQETGVDNVFENSSVNIVLKAFVTVSLQRKKANQVQTQNLGSIMRLRIQCNLSSTREPKKDISDDYLFFKLPGTFQVEIQESSVLSSLSVIASSKQSSYQNIVSSTFTTFYSTGSLVHPKVTPVLSATVVQSTVNVHSSSSHVNVHSTSSVNVHSTSSVNVHSTSFVNVHSTSSVNVHSTIQKMTLSKLVTNVQSVSILSGTLKPSSTIAYSSSVISSNPEKQSNDSSVTGAVTGAVFGVLVLVVMAVLFYVLRRRRERKESENADHGKGNVGKYINKNIGNVPLTALSNPVFQEGAYENPEDMHDDKKRQSGSNHIDSALYDQCLVVENPAARNVSLYDNIAQPKEHAYQALDPAKREPSAKYQSLIKPINESSGPVSESSSPEPVYSEVDDVPARRLMTTSNVQPKASGVVEPLYNVLEVDGAEATTTEDDHVYNILEQSNESEGKREPVYSVLDGEEN